MDSDRMNHRPTGTRGEPDARERARPVRRADRGDGPSERRRRAPVRPYDFAWLHRNRRLLVRYERDAALHDAFLHLSCALICWQVLQRTP